MAWTAPRTWTTTELVTAAMMNTHVRDNLVFLGGTNSANLTTEANGFTNTAFADLDALTTVPFGAPVIVSTETGTSAIVIVSATIIRNNTAPSLCHLGYRVSGATTTAASDNVSIRSDATGLDGTSTFVWTSTLTAGTNTFELQARVTANAGRINSPSLIVIPRTS